MKLFLRQFSKDDSGAVTVDWVVLTAIAVVLAILIMAIYNEAADGRIKVITDGIAAHF